VVIQTFVGLWDMPTRIARGATLDKR
jgi:hypothetical protein